MTSLLVALTVVGIGLGLAFLIPRIIRELLGKGSGVQQWSKKTSEAEAEEMDVRLQKEVDRMGLKKKQREYAVESLTEVIDQEVSKRTQVIAQNLTERYKKVVNEKEVLLEANQKKFKKLKQDRKQT